MRFRRSASSAKGGEFQMSPMIDIVFLLLIFFICATTFHQLESEEEIKLPVADQSKKAEKQPGTITVNIKRNGDILIAQRKFTSELVTAFMAKQTQKYGAGGVAVIIRADKKTHHKHVVKVMKACAKADIWNIAFSTFEREVGK